MEKTEWREVYSKQPVRMLILDVSSMQDIAVITNIREAMLNIFSLSCSLKGSPRISVFGLSLLGPYSKIIFPFQFIKTNSAQLFSVLENLANICKSFITCDTNQKNANDVIKEALQEATSEFKKFSQRERVSKSSTAFSKQDEQLQIILLSCQKMQYLMREIECILPLLDMTSVQKIQVACIFQEHALTELPRSSGENKSTANSQSSSATEETCIFESPDKSNALLNSMVESILLEDNQYRLESFFKTWLCDASTDKEHIHLTLETGDIAESVTIKCDMFERMLNPHIIPYNSTIFLPTDVAYHQIVVPNQAKTSEGKLPLYNLDIIALVKRSGLCESLFFEIPLIIIPTRCWKIDWEELEANQQRFAALCNLLVERDAAMLAKRKSQHVISTSNKQESFPEGYFIIIACKSSMLIRPVCFRELVMPNLPDTVFEQTVVSHEMMSSMEACLDKLSVLNTYNPVTVSNNLYAHLQKIHKPKTTQKAAFAAAGPSTSGNRFKFSNKLTTSVAQNDKFQQRKNTPVASLNNATKLTKLSALLNANFPTEI